MLGRGARSRKRLATGRPVLVLALLASALVLGGPAPSNAAGTCGVAEWVVREGATTSASLQRIAETGRHHYLVAWGVQWSGGGAANWQFFSGTADGPWGIGGVSMQLGLPWKGDLAQTLVFSVTGGGVGTAWRAWMSGFTLDDGESPACYVNTHASHSFRVDASVTGPVTAVLEAGEEELPVRLAGFAGDGAAARNEWLLALGVLVFIGAMHVVGSWRTRGA